MADIPSFIFTVLNKELFEIQRGLLERIANDKGLDATELVATYLSDPLVVTPNTKTKIEVVKKKDPRPPPEADNRCMARVWNRGRGGQCTRTRSGTDCDLCANHAKMQVLKHGRIDDRPPPGVFGASGARKKALYK
jgi:hypothetical protein